MSKMGAQILKLMKPFGVSSVLPEEEDSALMGRVQKGDSDAFRLLYAKYRRPIMSFLYSMIKNENVADELFQETFIKLYRARDRYEPSAKFSTYLWTIAKHTALDWLEKKREDLNPSTENEDHPGAYLHFEDSLESDVPNAEALLIEKVENDAVVDCLSRLGETDRMICGLRIHSELSYDEIAEQMQLSVSTVKTRLHRSKAQLEKCIRKKAGSL